MHIFFDTEFTQLRDGQLLSVGLVSDADDELVVEIHDPLRHARASQFCLGVVIPQFGAVPARRVWTDLELGRVVAAWLEQFEPPLTLCYDHELDQHFLLEALRVTEAWRACVPRVIWINVADVATFPECLAAQDRYFEGKEFPGRHHPLVDAKAMRERWRAYVYAALTTQAIGEGRWGICPKCFEGSGTVSEMKMEEPPGCTGHFAHFRYLYCPVCNRTEIL